MLTVNTLPAGTLIGDYEIEVPVGEGNMAVVYKAKHVKLGRPAAIKVLKESTLMDEDAIESFMREARSAASLRHNNLVSIFEIGQMEDGGLFMAMEYVEGYSLEDILEAGESFEPARTLEVAREIATALDYGWKKLGLRHGDIKPANIMLNLAGVPKLADFGLAHTRLETVERTMEEVTVTPLYASPEAILGKDENLGPLPDIYSFGCTIYHLLTGHPPFEGENPEKVCEKHLYEAFAPLEQSMLALPKRILKFVDRMISKEPSERPQSWEDVAQGLSLSAISKRKSSHAPAGKKRTFHMNRPAVESQQSVENRLQEKKDKRNTVAVWLVVIIMALGALLTGWLMVKDTFAQRKQFREWVLGLKMLGDDSAKLKALEKYVRDHGDSCPEDAVMMLREYREKVKEN